VANSGYAVKFTPSDASNYNAVVKTDVAITVARGNLTANAPAPIMVSASNTNSKTFSLSTIVTNRSDCGTLSYTPGRLTNEGDIFTAVPSVSGTDLSYSGKSKTSGWATQVINITSPNCATATVNIAFEATSKSEVVIADLTGVSTYTYDGSQKTGVTGTARSDEYTGTFDYAYTGREGTSYNSATPPENAGKYTLTVSLPSTAEYIGTATFEFEITKKQVTKPTIPSVPTLTYNGSEQLYGSIATNAGYTITGNKGTNAGTYTVKIALNDKANTEWSDHSTTDLTQDWSIGKASGAEISSFVRANLAVASNSITVKTAPVLVSATGQAVEYAKNNTNSAPAGGWQTTTLFNNLDPNSQYYIFARSKADDNHYEGTAVYVLVTTSSSSTASPPSSSSGGGTGGSTYGGSYCNSGCLTTPTLSQAETSNKALQIANGLSLSVNSSAVVSIYGLKGNLIQSQSYTHGEYSVMLNHLPKGMYIVKVSFGGSQSKVIRMTVK